MRTTKAARQGRPANPTSSLSRVASEPVRAPRTRSVSRFVTRDDYNVPALATAPPDPFETALRRIDVLAEDVGRARRSVEPESYLAHLLDRIALHVETLDGMFFATAGELCAAGVRAEEALARVDQRDRELRALLGEASR